MRRSLLLTLAILMFACTPLLAEADKLVLDPLGGDAPDFSVVQDRGETLRIDFTLPEIDSETVAQGNAQFSTLSIPGGFHQGEPGQAQIP